MATIISTKTSGVGGLEVTGDATGILQLASNNGTTAITVDASQNVGIGTSSPSKKLDVNGSINANGIELGLNGEAIKKASGALYIETGSANPIIYGTNSIERMRIDSSGSLLLNTSSNIALSGRAVSLQIYQYNDIKEAITIKAASPSYNFSSINFLNYGGSQVGYIYMTGSATQYSTSSDYRLKENIAPMTGALDTVAALKPVTYTWKIDGSEGQGFIAHELQEVVPDCVHGEKDAVDENGNIIPQGIDTSFLVATLTAAIQELKTIIDTQAERIAVLENK